MDLSIDPQSLANIAILVAPGYFAIVTYASIHARTEKDFSRLFVESIAFSVVIVSLYNYVWRHLFRHTPIVVTGIRYFFPLLGISILAGLLCNFFRHRKWVMGVADWLHLPGPDDDFIRAQFRKLNPDTFVTVKLRSGKIFSGTPQGGSAYKKGAPREYYFNNVAWFNKKASGEDRWVSLDGSLIINLEDAEYIEVGQDLGKPPSEPTEDTIANGVALLAAIAWLARQK